MPSFRPARLHPALVSALLAAAAPAAALAQPDAVGPARGDVELGAFPTVSRLPSRVAPTHVWSGGLTVAGSYQVTRALALEVALGGGWTPQLNNASQGSLNVLVPTLSARWTPFASAGAGVAPYVAAGVGARGFRFHDEVAARTWNGWSAGALVATGVRVPLGAAAALRVEVQALAGERGTTFGTLTGVSFRRPGARGALPRAPRVDTLRLVDTVRVVETVRAVDTVRVAAALPAAPAPRVVDTVRVVEVHAAPRAAERDEPLPPALLVLRDATFETGSAVLLAGTAATLDRLAAQLREPAMAQMRLAIVGHTDDVGADATNEALGLARADAVRDALVRAGIPAHRLRSASEGERRPVATNRTAAGRSLNRRVEIHPDR